MSSSWPIVLGLVALTLGAIWYDARNAPADSAPVRASPPPLRSSSRASLDTETRRHGALTRETPPPKNLCELSVSLCLCVSGLAA